MICEKCKHIGVLHAFSEGDCEACGDKVITIHIPCHKLCKECADKDSKCQQCGKVINL